MGREEVRGGREALINVLGYERSADFECLMGDAKFGLGRLAREESRAPKGGYGRAFARWSLRRCRQPATKGSAIACALQAVQTTGNTIYKVFKEDHPGPNQTSAASRADRKSRPMMVLLVASYLLAQIPTGLSA